jgi:hypothetical protein
VVDAEGRRAQFVSAATREWRRLVKLRDESLATHTSDWDIWHHPAVTRKLNAIPSWLCSAMWQWAIHNPGLVTSTWPDA